MKLETRLKQIRFYLGVNTEPEQRSQTRVATMLSTDTRSYLEMMRAIDTLVRQDKLKRANVDNWARVRSLPDEVTP